MSQYLRRMGKTTKGSKLITLSLIEMCLKVAKKIFELTFYVKA